jgi:hypothetical protein
VIVFVHIPKTGGNTLNRVIGSVAGKRAWIFNSELELDKKMSELPPGQGLDLDYLSGHFRLDHVKALLAERTLASAPSFVTLLRDPIERAFSLYLFILRVTTAIPQLSRKVQGRDFAYFVDYAYDHAEWHLRDAQTWLLCGERSAERAKEAIGEHLAVVGTTEAWGRFYGAVRRLSVPALPEDISGFLGNVAPTAIQPSDISQGSKPADWREAIGAASIRKLEHLNEADCELFDYVARERGGLIANGA